MVSRLAKNRYTWHGRAHLERTLASLLREGEKLQYGQQIQQIRQRNVEEVLETGADEKENEELEGDVTLRESNFAADVKGGA